MQLNVRRCLNYCRPGSSFAFTGSSTHFAGRHQWFTPQFNLPILIMLTQMRGLKNQIETELHQQRDIPQRPPAPHDDNIGPVPARYVRQSQMCPQLDMSDKNDQKTQDMFDKARCVRQKLQKIARYVRQMCQTKMKTKCKICLT